MTYISNKFKEIHILRDETIQKGKIKKNEISSRDFAFITFLYLY